MARGKRRRSGVAGPSPLVRRLTTYVRDNPEATVEAATKHLLSHAPELLSDPDVDVQAVLNRVKLGERVRVARQARLPPSANTSRSNSRANSRAASPVRGSGRSGGDVGDIGAADSAGDSAGERSTHAGGAGGDEDADEDESPSKRRRVDDMIEDDGTFTVEPGVQMMSVVPSNRANSSITALYAANKPAQPAKPVATAAAALRPRKQGAGGGTSSSRRKPPTSVPVETPSVTFADVAGMDDAVATLRDTVELPMQHPEVYRHLGVDFPRGVLLHGPPGCGKTLLANALAGELGVPFFRIAAPEIASGVSGESEGKLRSLFTEAKAAAPSIIFIDEIDAIVPKRESAGREMERRIVAQFLLCMDDLASGTCDGAPVMVIGATNRLASLDAALRRAGRFDKEIALGIPNVLARAEILRVLARSLRLADNVDFLELARRTPGYVGADLAALTKEAASVAVRRIFAELKPGNDVTLTPEQLEPLSIEMTDVEAAIKRVQPSAKREGFATIPDVTWDDVGALDEVRRELDWTIMNAIRRPEVYARMGIDSPAGVLLFGPPGCGKTLLAKAIASESGASFISIKGPELLNKYVGESERAVRALFDRANASAPCIVFFDEFEALCPRRGQSDGNASSERVVNQLLTMLDGLNERQQVFVVAATNRPDIIDPAMLRPGRLDKLQYVGLPSTGDRRAILDAIARKHPLEISQDERNTICSDEHTNGFSGADMAALVREAAVLALRAEAAAITMQHFLQAVRKVVPSVSAKDMRKYLRLRDNLAAKSRLRDDEPVPDPVGAPDADAAAKV